MSLINILLLLLASVGPVRGAGISETDTLDMQINVGLGETDTTGRAEHSLDSRFSTPDFQNDSELCRAGTLERYGWQPGDSVVVIPATARQIPAFAFAGVRGVKRVEFAAPSRCVKICEYAFAECVDLEEIVLPKELDTFGEGCFRDCRSLKSLEIGSGCWRLPKEFANRCESLERVSLPATLREMGDFVFANCINLKEITLPANLRKLGMNAFSRCVKLQEMVVPDCCVSVESYAFSDCKQLERVVLPGNSKMLGELIFSGCENLKEIVEMSPKPPTFECESFPFEPTDEGAYARCRVVVPAGAVSLYRRYHGWQLFREIEAAAF